ncbi:MAG: NAD(P)H-hydrate dehydratase [Candidatus Doudnabacteria bacterium]|nr:NAD(P)H-hydrate dehydratase [Candidatus Doudnabacteria bacterium]
MSKENVITGRIVEKLKLPELNSHKGDNGRLLIIAGSEKYHGSLLYAIKAAAKIVDLIYVMTTKENAKLVAKLKGKTAEFILVGNLSLNPSPRQGREAWADCVLIGPGMGKSKRTYKLVERVLKSKIRAALDADALNVMDKQLLKLLGPQHILTPHYGEFAGLLRKVPTSPPPPPLPTPPRLRRAGARGGGRWVESLKGFISKYTCTVVLKGRVDIVGNQEAGIRYNATGNEGMTKGGTGDVLAGLIAAFFCKNDAFTSAAAGVYINGKAGDELYKKVGPYYDAEDLAEQIPRSLWKLINN